MEKEKLYAITFRSEDRVAINILEDYKCENKLLFDESHCRYDGSI